MKNLQGDVIAITNSKGNVVARYTYDAWGECTIVSDTTGIIARINPYRYRGYYFDQEIGLYYLQSRYYDACVGRFINGDDIRIACSSLNPTHNSYLFVENDPVKNYDHLGYISIRALLLIIAALTGGISKLQTACNIINKSWFKRSYSVSTGLWLCFIAFIYGGVERLYKASKLTGRWWIVCGVIGAIVAVAKYVATSSRSRAKHTPNSLTWVALQGFVNAIDVPKKGAIKEIVKRILVKIGKSSLAWLLNLI